MVKNKRKQDTDIEQPISIEEDDIDSTEQLKSQIQPIPIQIKEVDNDDIPDELQSVIDECGADCSYTVGVFRYNEKTQVKEKVGTYQIQDFKPDLIAKNYGGGKYEYMIRVGNKLHRRLTTTYATAIVPEQPKVPTLQEIQTLITNNKQDSSNENNLVMKMLELQQQQTTALLTTMLQQNQNNQQRNTDDSFDKVIKLMTILGVKNANADTERFISIFQKGLNLSKDINSLRADTEEEDEDTGIISKLLKGVMNSDTGQELLKSLLQKLGNGKGQDLSNIANLLQQPQQPIENPIPETMQPQPTEQPLQLSSIDIVKNFLQKYKKKILIQKNSNISPQDLADIVYNIVIFDDELTTAFTEVFLVDYKPIIKDIEEFNEESIFSYVSTFLDKLKDLLYNNDDNDIQDSQEEVEDEQTVSTKNNNDK
jgi:hypothetical protein